MLEHQGSCCRSQQKNFRGIPSEGALIVAQWVPVRISPVQTKKRLWNSSSVSGWEFLLGREPDPSQHQFRTNKCTHARKAHVLSWHFLKVGHTCKCVKSWHCAQLAHHFFATEIIPRITELSSSKTAVCVTKRGETFSESLVWANISTAYTVPCGQMTCGNPPRFQSQGKVIYLWFHTCWKDVFQNKE